MSETSTAVERLKALADRINRNIDGSFGGAYVIIPPKEGEIIDNLIIGSRQDEAQFWTMLLTACQTALAELDARQRNGQAFGRR